MRILTSPNPITTTTSKVATIAQHAREVAEHEDRFSFSVPENVQHGLRGAGLGFVPVLGAGVNLALAAEAELNLQKPHGHLATVGMVSNLAGTATLAGSLLFGNMTGVAAGLGLLGVSGLTAAYAGFHL